MKFETQAIHAGFNDDPATNAVAVPIYQTTSYSFRDTQHGADLFNLAEAGNIYSRIMNPTCDVLEQRIAAAEGGAAALCVSSGMAAITAAVFTLCRAGDNLVSVSQLYGGTYNLFAHTLPQQGIDVRMAPGDDIAALEALIDDNTKGIFCESIGNPSGNIVDIAALSEMAHRHGIPVVVDNTVATPYLCRPFEHGADIHTLRSDGCTPVLMAARLGHTAVIKALYKLGADMKPDFNCSVTEIAGEYNHTKALQLVEKIMAKLTNECEFCGSSSRRLKLCSKCEKVRYCSRECQVKDHKNHKKECSSR